MLSSLARCTRSASDAQRNVLEANGVQRSSGVCLYSNWHRMISLKVFEKQFKKKFVGIGFEAIAAGGTIYL